MPDPIELKTATPDTSVDLSAVLFGADSQAATEPSVFGLSVIWAHLKTLANTWTALQTFTGGAAFTGAAPTVDGEAIAIASDLREKLTGAAVYYVRTDGNNSNTGLIDSPGGAFLTIQHAIDHVLGLDIGMQTVIIDIADGTYSEDLNISGRVYGQGDIVLLGNEVTPGNVVISSTDHCLILSGRGAIDVRGVRLNPGTAKSCFNVLSGDLYFQNVEFGTTTSNHMTVTGDGYVQAIGDYSIVGDAARHVTTSNGGRAILTNKTITLTGAPAFTEYVRASACSVIQANGCTFTGSATGSEYYAFRNAVIIGGGSGYFPGDSGGTTATGGLYS